MGLEPQQALIGIGDEIDAAVSAFAQAGKGSLVIAPQNLFVSNRARIIAIGFFLSLAAGLALYSFFYARSGKR